MAAPANPDFEAGPCQIGSARVILLVMKSPRHSTMRPRANIGGVGRVPRG
jgi:hypothetical protein